MLFDTPRFIVFLGAVVLCYWCLKFRDQNRLLRVASYFYGWWEWRFLCLMISSTVSDYFIVMKIDDAGRTENPSSSHLAVPAREGTP